MALLLLVVLAIAELAWGSDAARAELLRQIGAVVGPETAHTVETTITNLGALAGSGWAGLIGLGAALFGATVTFAQLQESMNIIWDIDPKDMRVGVLGLIRKRVLSLLMVLSVGCLLAASLAASAKRNYDVCIECV